MKRNQRFLRLTSWLINLFWYLSVLGILYSLFISYFIFVSESNALGKIGVPILLETKIAGNINKIQTSQRVKEDVRIDKRFTGSAFINHPSFIQKALGSLKLLIGFSSVFFCVHYLRRLLKSILIGNAFNVHSISELKTIAITLIWLPLFYQLINFLLSLSTLNILKPYLIDTGKPYRYVGTISFEFTFIYFVAIGGVIYAVANAFEYGSKLKQENDLTV